MKKFFSIYILFGICALTVNAQNSCPDCLIQLDSLSDDTLFMSEADAGFVNRSYDSDISFRLPKTTDPVYAIDSVTPPGFDINELKIVGLTNLPPGLSWSVSDTLFTPADKTDGCAKICGIPTQTGQFLVQVKMIAGVFGLEIPTSFDFPITIYPEPNDTVPFNIFGNHGCGPTEVTFYNNIPSNGHPGFQYIWDFGNLTISQEENPEPVLYQEPGTYTVFYNVRIDTADVELSNVLVTESTCDDFALPPILSGKPDLYIVLQNPNGDELLRSNVIENADFPQNFPVNFPIQFDSLLLQVFDKDDVLAGDDDLCGEVWIKENSTILKDSTFLTVAADLFNPLVSITKIDTVVIYESAPVPSITPVQIGVNCKDTLELRSSVPENIEWFFEGNSYSNDSIVYPDEPGRYWVTFTDDNNGCSATSDTAVVPNLVFPQEPIFSIDQNWLTLNSDISLSANQILQWQRDGIDIIGETTPTYCARDTALYRLIVTDTLTGCIAMYEQFIETDPDSDCTNQTEQPTDFNSIAVIFPNPTSGNLNIEWIQPVPRTGTINVFTLNGRLLYSSHDLEANKSIELGDFTAGMYLLQLVTPDQVYSTRIVKK